MGFVARPGANLAAFEVEIKDEKVPEGGDQSTNLTCVILSKKKKTVVAANRGHFVLSRLIKLGGCKSGSNERIELLQLATVAT